MAQLGGNECWAMLVIKAQEKKIYMYIKSLGRVIVRRNKRHIKDLNYFMNSFISFLVGPKHFGVQVSMNSIRMQPKFLEPVCIYVN